MTSSPSSPGVKRFQTKRAGASDARASGRPDPGQPARRYGATGRSSGRSSCAAIHACAFARSSGLRCSRTRKTIPTITATTRPNANSPRDTQAVSLSNERQKTKPSTQNVVAHAPAPRTS